MIIEYFIKPTDLHRQDFLDQLTKFDWDVQIGGKEYDVYLMSKCYHCQGGTGDNNIWVIRTNHELKAENFEPFNIRQNDWLWGIEITPELRFAKHGVRTFYKSFVTRLGEKFYEVSGGDFDYLYNKCRSVIYELNDNIPINFYSKKWKQELFESKILYRRKPALITNYYQGNVTIEPDREAWSEYLTFEDKKNILDDEKIEFPRESWNYEDEDMTNILTDILDPNIKWFR